MSYFQNLEEAQALASDALAIMKKHQLAPTPETYCVWYDYCANASRGLREAIDRLIATGTPLSESHMQEFYREFLTARDSTTSLIAINERIQSGLNRVLDTLHTAGQGNEKFAAGLAVFRRAVSSGSSMERLGEVLESLADETEKILEANRKLDADLTETAGQMARLQDELSDIQREVLTDSLTGIGNRRAFDSELAKAAALCEAHGTPMSLVLCDIDHFKRFNDTFGHQTGDEVLKLVARVIAQTVRPQDVCARYGGEEFAAIMAGIPSHDAFEMSEQIRKAISSRKIIRRSTGETIGNITMSFGVATRQPGESLVDLVQRADSALYQSKGAGRNRVTLASVEAEDAKAAV